jgi:hypothetical protein
MSSRVLVGAPDMSPEILIAALTLDGFACLPLLPGNLFEVTIARLIESMIPDEHRFEDLFIPPDGDNGEVLHIQIDADRDQMRPQLPLHYAGSVYLFGLGKVQRGPAPAQDQGGTLPLPVLLLHAALEVA